MVDYKFNEENTIEQIKRYIDKTYEKHYASGKYQATDMIIDAGHGDGFCMGNIIKYAMRYGKKPNPVTGEYRNQGDLLKIIHYAIIAIHLWVENKTNSTEDEASEEYLSVKREMFPRNEDGTRKGWYK